MKGRFFIQNVQGYFLSTNLLNNSSLRRVVLQLTYMIPGNIISRNHSSQNHNIHQFFLPHQPLKAIAVHG